MDQNSSSGGLRQHGTEFSVSVKIRSFLTSSRAISSQKKKASAASSLVSGGYQLVGNRGMLSCLSQCVLLLLLLSSSSSSSSSSSPEPVYFIYRNTIFLLPISKGHSSNYTQHLQSAF